MSADPHLLTGAYGADALSDTERLAFERHLDACPPCAAEARALRGAAARLVVAFSVTALGLGLMGGPGRSEPAADPVAAVLAAPDARRVAARAGGVGQAEVVVSRQRGRAVFVAAALAPAPAARTYQLWVVDRSGPRPAGLVEVPAGGRVTRLLEGRVTGSEQVAMTVERRGGAARPTSEPVVVVDLRA